jgi:spore coat protein CotH
MSSIERGFSWFNNPCFWFCLLSLLLAGVSCSNESADEVSNDAASKTSEEEDASKPSDILYDPDRLVDVQITMEPGDWDLLRKEGRAMTDVMSGCSGAYEYTWFNATVAVNGKTFQNVAVRKKGYLGSLSQLKPALKVDFNRNVKGQEAWGIKSLTLNNDRQDPSHTHQCMAYQLFRAAGDRSLAPRCNFAKVNVNGTDLGIYSNVESVKKDFLARYFENTDGNLYEGGQGADFSANAIAKFELKTNEEADDRSDLDRVVKAMEADDTDLFGSLEEVFDMDAFLTFWAMEVITGHWDSFSGDQNNFLVYHDPITDKFTFIPWGTDDAFNSGHNFLGSDIPKSVYAWSWPTYRLYSNPDTRAKYQERLRALLDKVWNEEKLLSEVDRIGALTAADEVSLEQQREFIRTRKQTIIDELDNGAPDWNTKPIQRLADNTVCIPSFDFGGQFDTTWGDLTNRLAPSSETSFAISGADQSSFFYFDLHTDDIGQPYSLFAAGAGFDPGGTSGIAPGTPTIQMAGIPSSGGPYIVVVLMFERSQFGAKELPFYAMETVGVVVRSKGLQSDRDILGFIGDGKVVFDEVGTEDGDRIKGSFTGVFVPSIFDQFK